MTMTTVIEDESNRSQSSGPTGMNEGVMVPLKNHVTHLRTCAVGMLFLAGTLLSDSVVRKGRMEALNQVEVPKGIMIACDFPKNLYREGASCLLLFI